MASPLQQYMKEREAGLKRTQELRSMSQKQVVEHLLKSEPDRIAQGHSVNLAKFLENKGASSDPNVPILKFGAQSMQDVAIQKPIDVSKITDSSWMRGSTYKQHDARKTLADFETIPSSIPTVEQEKPLSRRMGFGQGGGAANLGISGLNNPPPANFTQWALGRINTPVQQARIQEIEPEVIEKVETETKTVTVDYTKFYLLGAGLIALALLFILWRKKN